MSHASTPNRSACVLSLVAVLVGSPHLLPAHTNPLPIREIVRIRGTVAGPGSPCPATEVSVRVLGKTVRLCGSDVRRIAVASAEKPGEEEMPAVLYDLQGERAQLTQVSGAAPEARISILAEWRPGRRDLFLIDLDICRCDPAAGESALDSADGSR